MSESEYIPKRVGTIKKYVRIQERMKELHEVQRLRYDDCIQQIQHEFFIERPETVMRILRTEVEAPVTDNPNQLKLFDDELPKS